MKKILFVLLFFATSAFAVTNKTAYVNTDCANSGDGTASSCAASPGGAGAYNTLDAAIYAEETANADLVSSDINLTIDCRGATADGPIDAIGTRFTTDATRFLTIQGDFAGTAIDTSAYRIYGAYYACIRPGGAKLHVKNIQCISTHDGEGGMGMWITQGCGVECYFDKCLFSHVGTSTNSANKGVLAYDMDTGGKLIITNSIFYGFYSTIIRVYLVEGFELYLANLTLDGSQANENIYVTANGTSDVFSARNIVSVNAYQEDWYTSGSFATTDWSNIATDDGTSPEAGRRNLTITFADTHDYAIDGETDLIDQGTDLSSDTDIPFNDDIEGDTRSGTWDIGADEYVTGSSYRTSLAGNFQMLSGGLQ
jgi:hypothetical protein